MQSFIPSTLTAGIWLLAFNVSKYMIILFSDVFGLIFGLKIWDSTQEQCMQHARLEESQKRLI